MPYLEMKNSAERRIAAKAALYFWVSQGVEKIVLADATASHLLSQAELEKIDLLGTTVEQICYSQNQDDAVLKGKGYAEGELIRFALENSRFLEGEGAFFKSTGKTYVRNFHAIFALIRTSNIDILFWRHLGDGSSMQPWADCRLYFTPKEVATSKLVPAYLQSDDRIGACEYYIFEMLNKTLRQAKTVRPLISGFAGGTGEQYFDSSLGSLDFNAPCWVRQKQQ
jgi:hypothetical protein